MDNYLSIEIAGINFVISTYGTTRFFKQENVARIRADKPSNERTVNGNIVGYGAPVEDPHIWTIDCITPVVNLKKIQAMYDIHQSRFRTRQNPDILLIDAYQIYNEEGVRTRAVAPSPFNTITTNDLGLTEYFAQFYVWFAQKPTFKQQDAFIIATLSLEETERKVAP